MAPLAAGGPVEGGGVRVERQPDLPAVGAGEVTEKVDGGPIGGDLNRGQHSRRSNDRPPSRRDAPSKAPRRRARLSRGRTVDAPWERNCLPA